MYSWGSKVSYDIFNNFFLVAGTWTLFPGLYSIIISNVIVILGRGRTVIQISLSDHIILDIDGGVKSKYYHDILECLVTSSGECNTTRPYTCCTTPYTIGSLRKSVVMWSNMAANWIFFSPHCHTFAFFFTSFKVRINYQIGSVRSCAAQLRTL